MISWENKGIFCVIFPPKLQELGPVTLQPKIFSPAVLPALQPAPPQVYDDTFSYII